MSSVWQRLSAFVGSFSERTGLAGSLANALDPDTWLPGGRDAAFTLAIIALSAKMAVSDGVVTASELRAFQKTVEIPPGIEQQVDRIFKLAQQDVAGYEAYGSTIATLVETGDIWVEANFKETQLVGLRAGMPAEVTVDAFPGVKFEGQVSSIGAATGAEFALIPAQNATGNWVKVTQRIPVTVSVAGADLPLLRAGMSAVVNVDTKPAGSVPEEPKAH